MFACKGQQKTAAAENTVKAQASGDSLFASIERSVCFGRCPSYVISVYQSGYVTYEGRKFVKDTGLFYTFISPKQLEEISAMAEKVGFAEMKDAYHDPNIMDAPSTFTSFRVNGKIKRIDNTFGNPPQGLTDFEKFLDELFKETKWKKINNRD
jgi:hypothetical protein